MLLDLFHYYTRIADWLVVRRQNSIAPLDARHFRRAVLDDAFNNRVPHRSLQLNQLSAAIHGEYQRFRRVFLSQLKEVLRMVEFLSIGFEDFIVSSDTSL